MERCGSLNVCIITEVPERSCKVENVESRVRHGAHNVCESELCHEAPVGEHCCCSCTEGGTVSETVIITTAFVVNEESVLAPKVSNGPCVVGTESGT